MNYCACFVKFFSISEHMKVSQAYRICLLQLVFGKAAKSSIDFRFWYEFFFIINLFDLRITNHFNVMVIILRIFSAIVNSFFPIWDALIFVFHEIDRNLKLTSSLSENVYNWWLKNAMDFPYASNPYASNKSAFIFWKMKYTYTKTPTQVLSAVYPSPIHFSL